MMILTRQTLNENQIATLAQAALNGASSSSSLFHSYPWPHLALVLGLNYMFTVEKIHRDIKPHNILVNRLGTLMLPP